MQAKTLSQDWRSPAPEAPLIRVWHCFLRTSLVILEPPGTQMTFVKMSYLNHPPPSASPTSQRTSHHCAVSVSTTQNSCPLNSILQEGLSWACKAGHTTWSLSTSPLSGPSHTPMFFTTPCLCLGLSFQSSPPGECRGSGKTTRHLPEGQLSTVSWEQSDPPSSVCPYFVHTPIYYCHKDGRIASEATSWSRVTLILRSQNCAYSQVSEHHTLSGKEGSLQPALPTSPHPHTLPPNNLSPRSEI